jgi:hypothetical protein
MKHKYTLYTLVVLLFCSGWSGCKFGNTGDPIVVADVEKEFNVSMIERFEPGKRDLQFLISTIKNQPCQNYTIDFNWYQNSNVLDLNLSKIVAPENCKPGTSPAMGLVFTNPLDPGSYTLNISLGQTVTSKGRFAVNNDAYTMKMDVQNGFKILQNELLRIPDGVIWGFVSFQQTSSSVADKFIQDLFKLSSDKGLRKGYYGQFIISDSGTSLLDQPTDAPSVAFVRSFQDKTSKLESLIAQYRAQNNNGMTFKIYNTDGKEF